MSDYTTGLSSHRDIRTKRNGGQESQEGGLCEACQGIDFQSYFLLNVASKGGRGVSALRGVPQNWANSTCRLCRFFNDVCLRDESYDKYHLRLFDSYSLLHQSSNHKAITKRPHSTVLVVVPGSVTLKGKKVKIGSITASNLIAPLVEDTEMEDSPAIRARLLNITTPNYKLIWSFLEACQLKHDPHICARPTGNRPEEELQILLVDCHRLQVVDGHTGMPYFALSYVWGRPKVNVQELPAIEQHQLLSSRQLPKTIDDAIEVVKEMSERGERSERFLWVDMLCITKENKHTQIHQMHKIYEKALATLVAVEGDNVDHGIVGISHPRTFKQAIAQTKGRSVASIAQSLDVILRNSKWNQRAWTFQETVLSKRCIFFTSAQVYVVCRSGTACETLSGSCRLAYSLGLHVFGRLDKFDHFTLSQRQRNQLEFWKQLSVYMRRDLKFEQDALNAYMGVLSRCSYTTYWGIAVLFERATPLEKGNWITGVYKQDLIPINESKCFAIGLLWLCADPRIPRIQDNSANRSQTVTIREVDFPSWTWASLRMYASCNPKPLMEPFSITTRGGVVRLADILVENIDGSLKTIGHLATTARKDAESVIPAQTRWLHISHDCLEIALRPARTPAITNEHFSVPPSHEPYGHCSHGCKIFGSVWLDADIMANSNGGPDSRVEHEKWDAVQICCRPQKTSWWLVLDKRDDYYVRVGVMETSELAHIKSDAKLCPCRAERVVKTFRVG